MRDPNAEPKSEGALIQRIAAMLKQAASARAAPECGVDFGDDMACIPGTGGELLWSTDMLSEGVDFRSAEHAWRDIGWKALAVNLSDCAAMAVRPVGALCAVTLDERMALEDAAELHRGVIECGAAFGCPLVGGDTNSWPHPTVIAITVAARVIDGVRPLARAGAALGDFIFVTGRLGGSILGRHLRPTPRLSEAEAIARRLRPAAAIDISDGFARDLNHVLVASGGLGARLDESLLVAAIHPDAIELARTDGVRALRHALHDGEDFELIVILHAETVQRERATIAELGLIEMGVVEANSGIRLVTASGESDAIEPGGWEHFR